MQTILNIIIFLLCLSFVVCIHEAGHLLVAKACNVFCFEYSIGFGPTLFKKKLKHKRKVMADGKVVFQARDDGKKVPLYEKVEGETYFLIKALPLGGYVSMAGEDGTETEDGKRIPKERTLTGVNHAKQIAIMLAGIVMNFLLAWLLFFISALIPKTYSVVSSNAIQVAETLTINDVEMESGAHKVGLKDGDQILYLYQEYVGLEGTEETLYFPSTKEETQINSYQEFKDPNVQNTYDDLKQDCISYALCDLITIANQGGITLPEEFKDTRITIDTKRIIHLKTSASPDEWLTVTLPSYQVNTEDGLYYYAMAPLGISPTTDEMYYTFGDGSRMFGTLFVNLYKALGSIFTPSGWKNVGGIISVYKMSSEGFQTKSIAYILMLWGYISLNLGCFNLLPFPGLDGWQTLLALIESISRKKLSTKFKGIANTVGMILLFLLAGLLIVKDLIMIF